MSKSYQSHVVHDVVTADKDFLMKQKAIYELFYWREDRETLFPKLFEVGKNYDIEANIKCYAKPVVIKEFMDRFRYGILPRGRIFSVFYPELLEEAVALFKLFYYAKDFETFYKTAAWAMLHLNEGLFLYALSVAVLHRPDTKYMRIPPIYETYPYMFFNSEVFAKMIHREIDTETVHTTVKGGQRVVIIPAKYSEWYAKYTKDHEYKLNYFTEDPVLNNMNNLSNLGSPFWMSSEEFQSMSQLRGEEYFFGYRIQFARYMLERFCHDLSDVADFDWTRPIPIGYHPSIMYHNGLRFPERKEWADIPTYKYKYLAKVRDLESRISEAIDMGCVVCPDGKRINIRSYEGLRMLGNLVQGNVDSPNLEYYGQFELLARNILGFSPEPIDKYRVVPSVLQHYITSRKDPMYWCLVKRILGFYEQFTCKLPKYTVEELFYPGVKIESVTIDKLVTYFDTYDYLLTDAGKTVVDNSVDKVFASQFRLNHKPFTYHMNVHCNKEIKAEIRTFIGPKYDAYGNEMDLSVSYKYFVPLDEWIVDLKAGSNMIERSSLEAMSLVNDEMTGDLFYKKIVNALEGKEKYEYSKIPYGCPDRYVLPMGKKEGMPFQLFFCINHFDNTDTYMRKSNVWGDKIMTKKPLGFPLDRPPMPYYFAQPNFCFKEVNIYHVEETKMNVTV